MRYPVNEVRTLLERVFRAHGATADEAATLADVLIEAELRGRPTHGLIRAPAIARSLRERSHGTIRIVEERGPLVRIDGGDQSGYLVAAFMADTAVRVARRQGHALLGARNTRHSGMLGYYVSRVAEAGVVALMMADCGPLVTPWGARDPVLGTNPIAAAFPATPYPVLIDLGTGSTTYGAVQHARETGSLLPEGCALDAEGRPTTDPERVSAIVPFGGHRGYAIALMVQILSGAFVGAAPVPDGRSDYGIFMLAMRPDLFCSRDEYENRIAEVIRRVKSARPLRAGDEIRIPGERAWREREHRLRDGLDVPEELHRQLLRLTG